MSCQADRVHDNRPKFFQGNIGSRGSSCITSIPLMEKSIYTCTRYPDPRFTTNYLADFLPSTEVFYDTTSCKHGGPWFHNSHKLYIPEYVANPGNSCSITDTTSCCGYAPKRADKGYDLTVNDYPYNNVALTGGLWNKYVFPLHSPSSV